MQGGKIVAAERIDESATRTTAELCEHGVEATKVLVDVSTLFITGQVINCSGGQS